MKFLGLIGGEDLDGTAAYGRRITSEVHHRFGHGGKIKLMAFSLHTPELSEALAKQEWKRASDLLDPGVRQLVDLGAEAVVGCSSRLQPAIERLVLPVPLLLMADAVGSALQTLRIKRIGVIGAVSEGEESHWRKQLARFQVLDVFVPVLRDREHIAHLILDELQHGVVNQTTRGDVGRIVYALRQAGARAIVLVAPELNLALSHLDPVLPMLDATELHALSALDWSLGDTATNQSFPPRKSRREKHPQNHANTQA